MFECEHQSLLDIAGTHTVRVPQPKKVIASHHNKLCYQLFNSFSDEIHNYFIKDIQSVSLLSFRKLVNGPGDEGVTLICEYLCDLQPIKSEATWIELGKHIAR